jgi:hypothetical protein
MGQAHSASKPTIHHIESIMQNPSQGSQNVHNVNKLRFGQNEQAVGFQSPGVDGKNNVGNLISNSPGANAFSQAQPLQYEVSSNQ